MSKEKKIKVIVVRVGQPAVVEEVGKGLESMRALIGGGYLEGVTMKNFKNCTLMCDGDGIGKKMPVNRVVFGHVIHGDFFIARANDSGNEISLTLEDINGWLAHFNETKKAAQKIEKEVEKSENNPPFDFTKATYKTPGEKCDRCGVPAIHNVCGKTSDACYTTFPDGSDTGDEGDYVPTNLRIAGPKDFGDYIQFSWCENCGQMYRSPGSYYK